MKKQLLFLVSILENLDFKRAIQLSNRLASKGFLTLIPHINMHYKYVYVIVSCMFVQFFTVFNQGQAWYGSSTHSIWVENAQRKDFSQ